MSSSSIPDPPQDPDDAFQWEQGRLSQDQPASEMFLRVVRMIWKFSASGHKGLGIGLALHVLRMSLDPLSAWILALIVAAVPTMHQPGSMARIEGLLVLFGAMKILDVLINAYGTQRFFWTSINRLHYAWPHLCQEKLLSLPTEFHDRHGIGKQVSKLVKGCGRMTDMTIDFFHAFVPGIVFWIVNTLILVKANAWVALALMLPVMVAIAINAKMQRTIGPVWEKIEKGADQATKGLVQSIVNVATVQACVQEAQELLSQKLQRDKIVEHEDEALMKERVYQLSIMLCLMLGYVLSMTVALVSLRNGHMSVSAFAYVLFTGRTAVDKFWQIMDLYRRMMRHCVAIERVGTLLEAENPLPNNPGATCLPDEPYTLEFRKAVHAYRGRPPAINGLSLRLSPGKMIAFIGQSGGGKSTIVKLLMRIYDLSSGRITINERDITTVSRDWYRGLFAYVPQDTALFDDTIRANVSYGVPNASEEAIREALEAAHLYDILHNAKRFPNGLDTVVGERGVMLSGGERQRVGIARAYLKILCGGARFLVLDEATASLDSEAETIIQGAITRLQRAGDVTIIVIAHRLSTVRMADEIHVIKGGVVVESGTHRTLLASNKHYAQLVRSQDLHRAPAVATAI